MTIELTETQAEVLLKMLERESARLLRIEKYDEDIFLSTIIKAVEKGNA